MNNPSVGFHDQHQAQQSAEDAATGLSGHHAPSDGLFDRVRRSALARFSDAPFHKVGMRAIARDAGTGMAGLYEIAGGKERLLQACLAPDIKARAERVDAASRREVSCRSRLRACITELIAFDLARPDFARIVRLNTPARLVHEADTAVRIEQILTEVLRRGVREGSIRTDLPVKTLVGLTQSLVDGALTRWAVEEAQAGADAPLADAQARADGVFALLWPAICAD